MLYISQFVSIPFSLLHVIQHNTFDAQFHLKRGLENMIIAKYIALSIVIEIYLRRRNNTIHVRHHNCS